MAEDCASVHHWSEDYRPFGMTIITRIGKMIDIAFRPDRVVVGVSNVFVDDGIANTWDFVAFPFVFFVVVPFFDSTTDAALGGAILVAIHDL